VPYPDREQRELKGLIQALRWGLGTHLNPGEEKRLKEEEQLAFRLHESQAKATVPAKRPAVLLKEDEEAETAANVLDCFFVRDVYLH
jgi:hypothetical protein